MKKITLLLVLWLAVGFTYAQTTSTKSIKLDEKSIVKDAEGSIYPFAIWKKLIETGEYNVKSISGAEDNEFLLYRLTEEEIAVRKKKRAELVSTMPRPRASDNFREGERFRFEKMKDIDGVKFDFKADTGKVVVFNFWFINCPPCKKEIPELNELVEKYKQNKDVVFIAIALDDTYALKDFLRAMPFKYNIVGDGRYYAQKYGVKSFPTHVIVGKDGLIRFSTVGLASNTIHWVDKTIKEAL
ncbi:TlpA family protein disulfide reductase [Pedobacter chitinilyticus]|uniref:TlpA family protein disulfide reductase n=1 Tax=Pedobacter chitinilyticus TaxID=2233776 RepID=A0A3S3R8B1_9SPHI|nr:TlpA disulfide reductase family protein [Pedobacter chitinilyticus]RWU10253.1 TlpA family protein disulfide reductase [Pedobacter chitinilyticus]